MGSDFRSISVTETKTPTLHELMEPFRTTMLITRGEDVHRLRARPMAVAKLEPNCRVWLITSQDSAKVHAIESCTAVHLSMQKEGETYLFIDGHAVVVVDRDRIRSVWDDSFAPWFPQGADDPDIALIAVTPERAEYWDHRDPIRSGPFDPTEAYVHGTKPEQH